MDRRTFLTSLGIAGTSAVAITSIPHINALAQLGQAPVTGAPAPVLGVPGPWAAKLIAAAESQIGVTVTYDPAYVKLPYPGGDVPRDRGVCTDVVVRAYRDGLGVDLQQLVHVDMAAHFRAYPTKWGLKQPDHHIDHRRVANLQTFFARHGAKLAVSQSANDYAPGDLVTMMVSGTLPHIAIIANRPSLDGARPLIIHNIGAGTLLEDRLFEFPLTGHYRFKPAGV